LALTSILAVLGACGGGSHDAGGRNPLTAVSPAGEYCEHGGNKIEAGVDADGNGSLGSNEISGTYYACNGAAGEDGEFRCHELDCHQQSGGDGHGEHRLHRHQ
jgi:hypothetical protein